MVRAGFILLLYVFRPIRGSCFTQAPWTNIHLVLQMINPCPTIEVCEANCLAITECAAYAFVNAKCALLRGDSGKPQTCVESNPTYWLRTPACDASSTIVPTTTTLTGTPTTAVPTTTLPGTTATTAAPNCIKLQYDSSNFICQINTCSAPIFSASEITCDSGKMISGWDDSMGSGGGFGSLKCVGNKWIDDLGRTIGTEYMVYCRSL